MYFHPYPVGYKASKYHFNRLFHMTIEENEYGPIFTVSTEDGRVWSGDSPTKPWTKACIAYSNRGTRVSGPLVSRITTAITINAILQSIVD